jgi:hypothetical protein
MIVKTAAPETISLEPQQETGMEKVLVNSEKEKIAIVSPSIFTL